MLNISRSLDAYEYARQIGRADVKRQLSAQSPQPEMFTPKESLALHRGRCLHHGLYQTDRTFRKINAGHRLIDLECPWLSCLRINMVPVIQSKRHVAILLNLEHHKVAAQRVNRACAEENGVTGLRSQTCEVVRHCPVRERAPQIGFRSTVFRPA